jgi:GNAT superfamily N-acetyltransferase
MSGALEIRDAAIAERETLGDLHRRSSYVWEEDRANLDAHPDALGVAEPAIAEGRVRVAVTATGDVVAFSVVAYPGGAVCELDDLFVDPTVMRTGIGRSLVADAVARAVAARCRTMTVIAHPRTFGFYESVGFTPGESVSTRFGPATLLRRPLPPTES